MKNQTIDEAMQKAAQSFNMIIGCEAIVNKLDFTFPSKEGLVQYSSKIDVDIHVLKTEVAGNLSGTSYLILSPEDVNKIHKKSLPAEMLDKDNAKAMALKGGVLLEIDNIISAGAVTVFANHMDQMLYGDVPKLKVLSKEDINKYLASEIENLGHKNCLNAVLHVNDLDLTVDFFWVFEDAFFEQLLQPKTEVA